MEEFVFALEALELFGIGSGHCSVPGLYEGLITGQRVLGYLRI